MKLNLNEYVRVKLTPYGKQVLLEQYEEWHKLYPAVFDEFRPPEEDEYGYSEWQLWKLMETFGQYIHTGELPFYVDIEIKERK